MNHIIKFLLITSILVSSCNKKESQPNIVFIMSDDHAFQAVSAYGHNLNNTPNIDRIAGSLSPITLAKAFLFSSIVI